MQGIQAVASPQQQRRLMPPQTANYNAVKIGIHNPQVNSEQKRAESGDVPAVGGNIPQNFNAVDIDIHNPQVNTGAKSGETGSVSVSGVNFSQNTSAVKIDIYNPQVNTGAKSNNGNQTQPVIYDYPKSSVYETPKKSIYEPKSAVNMTHRTPIVPAPVVIQQSIEKAEKEPNSVLKKETAAVAEAPKHEVPAAEAKKVDVKAPEPVKPVIDINAYIKELASDNYRNQARAMEAIVGLVEVSPNMAVDLLDVKVIDTLLNLVNLNTSNLTGPTPRQIEIRERILKGQSITDAELAEANKITPLEHAERNKQFAIYTIASLDKLFSAEVKKITGEQPPITELPGMSDIVEQIKSNPNPMVRSAGIRALNYIKTPEYKDELKAIYEMAAKDSDPVVSRTAQSALKRLEA